MSEDYIVTIKIGDTLWMRDNRDGRRGWESRVIIGETKQSWNLDGSCKVLKKTMLENMGTGWGHQRWYTLEGKEAKEFCDKYARNIGTAVGGCADPAKLREIASIIDMELS